MYYLRLFLCMLLVSACGERDTPLPEIPQKAISHNPVELSENALIRATADSILVLIEQGNTAGLTHFTSSGIVLSPYVFIDPAAHVKMPVDSMFDNETTRLWAYEDGSGSEIRLSPRAYLDQYIREDHFSDAPQVSVNQPLGRSNSADNTGTFFKNSVFAEYYYPGFEKKFGGLDWVSLRVYLQKTSGGYKLTGLIGNRWTI